MDIDSRSVVSSRYMDGAQSVNPASPYSPSSAFFADPSDAVALMSVVSSFYSAEDDLLANLRHYCLKSALRLPTATNSSVPGGEQETHVERQFLTSSLQQKWGGHQGSFAASFSGNNDAISAQEAQDLQSALFELASIVEQHVHATSQLRAASRKMVHRMTVRQSCTGSTYGGGARPSAAGGRSTSMHTMNMLGDVPLGASSMTSAKSAVPVPGMAGMGGGMMFGFGGMAGGFGVAGMRMGGGGGGAGGGGWHGGGGGGYGGGGNPFHADSELPSSSNLLGPDVASGASPTHGYSDLRSTASVSSFQSAAVAGTEFVQTDVANITHDSEGNKLINEYLVIGELGRGAYGKVKLVEHRHTGDLAAIKIINRSVTKKSRAFGTPSSNLLHIQTEIAVMKKMRHRNIVSLFEVIDDPAKDKMYLVMQYIPDGPLLKLDAAGTCSVVDPHIVRLYAKQLASGLNYLHRHNVVHRDIKPDNILKGKRNTVYLCDFGVSQMRDDGSEMVEGSQGTPAFLSPEIFRGEGVVHGKAVDMWALGVTLYACLFGKLPFFAETREEISYKVQNESVVYPAGANQTWVALLRSLLNKDPNQRITAGELHHHAFLQNCGRRGRLSRSGAPKQRAFQRNTDGQQQLDGSHTVPAEAALASFVEMDTIRQMFYDAFGESSTTDPKKSVSGLVRQPSPPHSNQNSHTAEGGSEQQQKQEQEGERVVEDEEEEADVPELLEQESSANYGVVFVEAEEIERAIAVGASVNLTSHETPRQKMSRFVNQVRRRIHTVNAFQASASTTRNSRGGSHNGQSTTMKPKDTSFGDEHTASHCDDIDFPPSLSEPHPPSHPKASPNQVCVQIRPVPSDDSGALHPQMFSSIGDSAGDDTGTDVKAHCHSTSTSTQCPDAYSDRQGLFRPEPPHSREGSSSSERNGNESSPKKYTRGGGQVVSGADFRHRTVREL